MITKNQYGKLDFFYDYYNKELFQGILSDCMLTTYNRRKQTGGFFINKSWKNKETKNTYIHEINLNPIYFDNDNKDWHSTLVHEMVHLWQQDYGKPSRSSYHNKEFAEKMIEIGLMPSNTGLQGGKKTGQSMSHYIIPDGLFINIFNKLTENEINYMASFAPVSNILEISDKSTEAKKIVSKLKYTCPCITNIWGKPGLDIICGRCGGKFASEL